MTEKCKQEILQERIAEFNERMDWDQFHTPENLAKSISIEAAELLECFQWNDQFDEGNVCDELADVYSYVIMMAQRLGVDLNDIAMQKLEKTKAKYPEETFRGISTKYNRIQK